jgi:hypothetical protein
MKKALTSVPSIELLPMNASPSLGGDGGQRVVHVVGITMEEQIVVHVYLALAQGFEGLVVFVGDQHGYTGVDLIDRTGALDEARQLLAGLGIIFAANPECLVQQSGNAFVTGPVFAAVFVEADESDQGLDGAARARASSGIPSTFYPMLAWVSFTIARGRALSELPWGRGSMNLRRNLVVGDPARNGGIEHLGRDMAHVGGTLAQPLGLIGVAGLGRLVGQFKGEYLQSVAEIGSPRGHSLLHAIG